MNYNERNPIFSFRLDEKKSSKLTKLAKLDKISRNEMARKIIDKYLANELVEKKEDREEKLLDLRIKKLEAEIKYMEIKNTYFEAFHKPMSRSATVMIKPEIIVETNKPTSQIQEISQSPYDAKNKRLQCIDCGTLFLWKSHLDFNSQIVEYQRHIKSKHNRELTTIEHDVILKLTYEGDSQ